MILAVHSQNVEATDLPSYVLISAQSTQFALYDAQKGTNHTSQLPQKCKDMEIPLQSRLCPSIAGGTGLIPGLGTKIPQVVRPVNVCVCVCVCVCVTHIYIYQRMFIESLLGV